MTAKARCPNCREMVKLTKDGLLRQHDGRQGRLCLGSWKSP